MRDFLGEGAVMLVLTILTIGFLIGLVVGFLLGLCF